MTGSHNQTTRPMDDAEKLAAIGRVLRTVLPGHYWSITDADDDEDPPGHQHVVLDGYGVVSDDDAAVLTELMASPRNGQESL